MLLQGECDRQVIVITLANVALVLPQRQHVSSARQLATDCLQLPVASYLYAEVSSCCALILISLFQPFISYFKNIRNHILKFASYPKVPLHPIPARFELQCYNFHFRPRVTSYTGSCN